MDSFAAMLRRDANDGPGLRHARGLRGLLLPTVLALSTALALPAALPAQAAQAPLAKDDCALLVVSAGLAKFGAKDLGGLYEFAQKAGAALPQRELADCYGEIRNLGDDDGTAAGIARALAELAAKHRAVDLILHTHGKPLAMVAGDGEVDVGELALAANPQLASRAAAAQARPGVDVAFELGRRRWLAAAGGGGFGLGIAPAAGFGASRFRLCAGGELRSGSEAQLATRTGHYLRVDGDAVLADGEAAAATRFVLGFDGAFADRCAVRLGLGDGKAVQIDEHGAAKLVAGEGTPLAVRLVKPLKVLAVPVLPAAAVARLRCVLTTACYGASEAPGWRNLGFAVAAGSRGVSADSATAFPTFLHYWKRGYTFAEAVAAANRSDPIAAQDRIAAQRFAGVDSRREVLGDGELDVATGR